MHKLHRLTDSGLVFRCRHLEWVGGLRCVCLCVKHIIIYKAIFFCVGDTQSPMSDI